MDRTSILGDTIDYMKELTERIKTLEEEIGATPEELNLLNARKNFSSDSNSNDHMPMRNSTKVYVKYVRALQAQANYMINRDMKTNYSCKSTVSSSSSRSEETAARASISAARQTLACCSRR
jgi:hypothetical protein